MHAIELDRVTKRYGAQRGIEDVSFEVPAGSMFGFIGPNGAGKTTTIRLLVGLLTPTSGTARLFGVDLAAGPRARIGIGYVPGEPQLYPGERVGELLEYLGRFHDGDHEGRRRELARLLDLDLAARTSDLSRGNRQKVVLVAALQHAPRLVLLDEPTSGLDPVMKARLFDLLRDQVAGGATVFFSSHALAEVEAVCERVAILNEGRVVAVDDVEALRRRALRRVEASFAGSGNGDALAGLTRILEGVQDFERHGSSVSFLYRGSMPPLLDALAASSPSDVRIEEASLEDIFLHDFAPDPRRSSHAE
ncbi:MAG: ABC transporter ATP-binding protein [Kofleriaceae bacterium]